MVTTRGKKINFSAGSSDGEIDIRASEKPTPKRRRTKKSGSADGDPGFAPSSSSGQGKDKATLNQNQLITRRSGKGGKLRDLMNMPVDIFTEVCSYLDPYDLRRLALTSKRLWDILMTKEARHIWKTALESVPDLPECPTDLNEPQYVCLLYSSECYTIGCTSRGTKADWFHRIRFCTTCYETKMANEWNLRFSQQNLNLGFQDGTLCQIRDYFDMMRSGCNYLGLSSRRSKNDERHYYIEALKTAGHEYEALSGDEAQDYLSLLQEKREYRIETGSAILKWKWSQVASRAHDIATEKIARCESIKAKLRDLGWDEEDFPFWKKEFKDLVLKDQKLTPKVWQNLKPKLEPFLETTRANRLEAEKPKRQRNRKYAIDRFYNQLGQEVMEIPFGSFLPGRDELLALPSVKLLLETDTETVSKQQWIEVAPEVRLMVIKWWRDSLKRLAHSAENGGMALPDETDVEAEGESSPEVETEDEIASSISALKAKLSFATNAFFHCGGRSKFEGCYTKIWWFPKVIQHGSSAHSCNTTKELLNKIQPLQSEGQELVKRLLKDLKLNPETVKVSDVVINDQSQENFLCTRCDERVARYMSFGELIEHYLSVQQWFDDVTDAVRNSPDSCYPSRAEKSELPKIVNDHDWLARDALLVRQDDEEARQAVLKMQRDFRKEELTDPLCDTEGIEGEDLERYCWREVQRCCLLCPRSFAPLPRGTRRIEWHIRSKHDKEPDLETDTTLDIFYSSNYCSS
ncbi:hypothetical protein M407DRAFT_17973 [Tulasnella calospora MUT 4182]|uniref:F-box domain-containing protein n=1 Tax=Tulasnella calospora MUT 4182 TaxID=1051891 RepID=A0A0C3MHB9_9AGAM|nr:hypothetical protein M407DRAFT_17973 [Tulasnella calospora MUT 4182]